MKSSHIVAVAVGVAAAVFSPTAAYSNDHVSVQVPAGTDISCNDAVDEVAANLAERGFFVPWNDSQASGGRVEPKIFLSESNISENYINYPPGRTQTIIFSLSGDPTRLYEGLMSSPQFMSTLSAKIMAECSQVGIVEFAHWWEGVAPIGYFTDGTARPFEWKYTDWVEIEPLEWGYFYSL